jgi:hypothetical protein
MKSLKFAGSCVSLIILLVILNSIDALAELPDYDKRVYYFYEVGNQIPLSDFNLGSDETIRDQDGNGLGFSYVFKKGKNLLAELDLGYSRTVYKGRVEDGVEVAFEPQTGSGYDILSSSTNVVYDFDLEFQNPYIGINFVFFFGLKIGGGRIIQSSSGDVILYAEDIKIAEAEYETKNQLYGQVGFEFNLDWLYVGGFVRAFEAPALKITYCNEVALGTLACSRIKGAAGNRNLRSNAFGEGVLQLGILF